jgi:hypothetical protein
MSGTSAQCHSAGLQFGAAVEDVETTLTAQRSGKRFQDPTTVVSYVVEKKDTKGQPPAGTNQCVEIVRIELRSLNENGSEPHHHRHCGHPEQRTVRADGAR